MATLGSAKTSAKVTRTKIYVDRSPDNKVYLPDNMPLEQLDTAIHDRMAFDKKVVAVSTEFETPLVFEAAYALYEVMTEHFGWADMIDTPPENIFDTKHPPVMISVPVSPTENVQIPLGRFKVPGVTGYLESVISPKVRNGPLFFFLNGEVLQKDKDAVNTLVELVRERIRTHSIYRGHAIGIQLTEHGEQLPLPKLRFLTLDAASERNLILPEITAASVQAHIFTFIEHTDTVRKLGIGLKRGVLLSGVPGTGKTMIANAAAVKSVRHGWTYIVCEQPFELAEIIRLARAYQPAVVFCEDLDRLVAGEERTMGIDEILNVVDGVESKGTEIMVVFTTNDLSRISTPMLRPGRLDAVIPILPPDAEAAQRLMRLYGRGRISDDELLPRAAAELAGSIPAVIQQAAESAMVFAINADNAATILANPSTLVIDDEALYHSAAGMREHRALLEPKEADKRSETVKGAQILADAGLLMFPLRPTGDVHGEIDSSKLDVAIVRKETQHDDRPHAN